MTQRFVSIEEAAQRLGITRDRLNALRENGQARAFRDGASWKFKEDEVERLAKADLSPESAADSSLELSDDSLQLDLPDEDLVLSEESDSILLNEVELEEIPEGASSTIIGREGSEGSGSDLELTPHAEPDASSEVDDDDLLGVDDSQIMLGDDSQLRLDDSGHPIHGESNVLSSSSGGSGVLDEPASTPRADFRNLEELDIDLDSESSQIGLAPASDIVARPSPPQPPAEGESSIKLASDGDDDVVLGEQPSSDITLSSQQSGISLVDASDTGLSLDEAPVGLGGSSPTLDRDEDDHFTLAGESGKSASLSSIGGDEFVLDALEGSGTSLGPGSGSQVMSFDLEGDIDENTATILGTDSALGSALGAATSQPTPALEEDVSPAASPLGPPSGGLALPAGAATIAIREAQYSAWNIVFLTLCILLLLLTGAMLFDLMRNIWSWDSPTTLSSSLMDSILQALP